MCNMIRYVDCMPTSMRCGSLPNWDLGMWFLWRQLLEHRFSNRAAQLTSFKDRLEMMCRERTKAVWTVPRAFGANGK